MTEEERFAQHIMPGADGCLIWTGSRRKDGYGRVMFRGRVELAHRVAYFLAHGKWAKPCTLHECDNRPCVRVNHLSEGTKKRNSQDMVRRGRHGTLRLDARRIRATRGTCKAIAKKFGCSASMVSLIRSKKRRNLGV